MRYLLHLLNKLILGGKKKSFKENNGAVNLLPLLMQLSFYSLNTIVLSLSAVAGSKMGFRKYLSIIASKQPSSVPWILARKKNFLSSELSTPFSIKYICTLYLNMRSVMAPDKAQISWIHSMLKLDVWMVIFTSVDLPETRTDKCPYTVLMTNSDFTVHPSCIFMDWEGQVIQIKCPGPLARHIWLSSDLEKHNLSVASKFLLHC